VAAATLNNTQGIIALAALAVAVVALIACGVLMRAMHRMRAAQKLVLGDGSARDMVAHSASLHEAFEALREYVNDMAVRLDGRLDSVEDALTSAISRQALIRYDAYNEPSGQQSVSIALLDGRHSGVVLTCIHHRDQARVYAKQVLEGRGEFELSPEEDEAVRVAIEQRSSTSTPPGAQPQASVDSANAADA